MGFFSCFRGKGDNWSSRGKGPALALPNPHVPNELPTPIAAYETIKRATSSAKELQATSLSLPHHREKKLQAARPTKESLSESSRNEDYLTHTAHQKSQSPEPNNSPRFVDSAIGTPESKRSTPGASRSTSSKLSIPTGCDPPSTPTPAQRYISRGTNPSPPPITPFILKASQTYSVSEEYPAESSVPKAPQTHGAPEHSPPTPSFSTVPPKPEPKVSNLQTFSSPSLEPVTRRASSVTPKLEPECEVLSTQIHSNPSASSPLPPFYTASHAPERQPFPHGTQKQQLFTSGPQSTQGTQSLQSSNIATRSTQGTRSPQSFNSSPQSSQFSTSGIQLPQRTQQTEPFSYSPQPTQSSYTPQPLNFTTALHHDTQAYQPSNFGAPPPQSAQQSPFFFPNTQQAPRHSPTNAVVPSYNTRTDRGAFCHCSAPNTILPTKRGENVGRDYRECSKCKNFNGFTDHRGLSGPLGDNQLCWCVNPAPMRLVLKGRKGQSTVTKAFYSCQYKLCSAWEWCQDENGRDKWFGQAEITQMIESGYL